MATRTWSDCATEVGAFFFFSSRRRHTRCGRDWSSDVALPILADDVELGAAVLLGDAGRDVAERHQLRSEERRVGKECRSRWSRYHSKKKTTVLRRLPRIGIMHRIAVRDALITYIR